SPSKRPLTWIKDTATMLRHYSLTAQEAAEARMKNPHGDHPGLCHHGKDHYSNGVSGFRAPLPERGLSYIASPGNLLVMSFQADTGACRTLLEMFFLLPRDNPITGFYCPPSQSHHRALK